MEFSTVSIYHQKPLNQQKKCKKNNFKISYNVGDAENTKFKNQFDAVIGRGIYIISI